MASFKTACIAGSGSNGFPFSMPIGLQHVDHRAVAVDPRLVLHEAVERLEETQVVGNGAVKDDVDRIDECRSAAGSPACDSG